MVGQWKIHGHNLFGDLAGVGDYVGSSSSDRKCREHLPPDYSEPSTSLSRRCWRSMRASSNPSTEIDRRKNPQPLPWISRYRAPRLCRSPPRHSSTGQPQVGRASDRWLGWHLTETHRRPRTPRPPPDLFTTLTRALDSRDSTVLTVTS